jgi:hypothetical protein
MADVRESFTILEDDVTGAGVKLPARVEGDTPNLKNGLIGFSFKDSSGNVILPQLNLAGQLPVTLDAGTCKSGTAKVTSTGGLDDVVTVTLTAEKNYLDIGLMVSSSFATAWEVVYIDDAAGTPAETVILQGPMTGPGQYSFSPPRLDCAEFNTIGGTGVQELVLRATQFVGPASDLRGFLSTTEA